MDIVQITSAFVEGLALIVSPCILPVLPLILSASADGGRARPFGIITGFVVSFSLFVLLSRKLVNAFHIDLDIIKYVSLGLLFIFGLVLLSGKLSEKFSALTQGAANLGNKVAAGGKGGFFSGIVIGALIGLVWTPCAGPILAAVLVQVILQKNDLSALFVIAAFAVGAGVPMLVIALMGRKIIGKLGFFTRHAEAIRKIFGVIIILTVIYIAFVANVIPTAADTVSSGPVTALENPLDKPYPAPQFAEMQWLNSKPLTMAELKGKVVLVDFWTYSCINCLRTLPYVTAWDAKYRDKGLVIIGVHSPEFEFEKNADNVRTALKEHGIKYPVALDNDLATWQNFNNEYWPAHYLIDQNGNVVYTHFGEGDYDVTENNIRYLLGLKDKAAAAPEAEKPFTKGQTSETYLGSERGHPGSYWSLEGGWKTEPEKITSTDKAATIKLNFIAKKAFLVMGTADGKPVNVTIKLNGNNVKELTVDHNKLYELVDQDSMKSGVLEIIAGAPGLEAYAFTFGN